MIRIAFFIYGGGSSLGNINYLTNLITALVAHSECEVEPVVFRAEEISSKTDLAALASTGAETIATPVLNAARSRQHLIRAIVFGRVSEIEDLLVANHCDCLFENAVFTSWRSQIPRLAWIPDFQHKALPHMFKRLALLKRELGFRAQLFSGRTLIVSSEAAKRDFERYYAFASQKPYVVRFPSLLASSAITDPAGAARRYEIAEPYFYIPNQFWKHKNHGIVINALEILERQGLKPLLVLSGRQQDPRHPKWFAQLKASIEKSSVNKQIKMLGLIPYKDVINLNAGALAIINPSRFEGWSTSVEEAKALGTPLILSNLPVHIEQTQNAGNYFDPDDANALAHHMMRALNEPMLYSRVPKLMLLELNADRTRDFALNFAAAVTSCVTPQNKSLAS